MHSVICTELGCQFMGFSSVNTKCTISINKFSFNKSGWYLHESSTFLPPFPHLSCFMGILNIASRLSPNKRTAGDLNRCRLQEVGLYSRYCSLMAIQTSKHPAQHWHRAIYETMNCNAMFVMYVMFYLLLKVFYKESRYFS